MSLREQHGGKLRVRVPCRWPPRMVERMEAFLALASSKQLSVT